MMRLPWQCETRDRELIRHKLDSIFGAFFTTKSHGMGMGLAICRTIIEHHGGQLTASSNGKNWSLFQFVLPVKFAHQEATS